MKVPFTVYAPMRLEASQLRRTLGAAVERTGTGPRRARLAASRLGAADAIAVAGIGGGLGSSTDPGDVVVATEVRGPGIRVACSAAPRLADALARRGLSVRLGSVVSAPRIATGRVRRELSRTGALAVDTESAWLLDAAAGHPVACVRVVADAPPTPLFHPRTLRSLRTALARLPAVGDALAEWAAELHVTVPTVTNSTRSSPICRSEDCLPRATSGLISNVEQPTSKEVHAG